MERHILYRWYNTNDELLYVGITKNAYNRHKQHINNKEWCVLEDLKETKYEYFDSRELLIAAEKLAIVLEKPKYNVTYNENPIPFKTKSAEPRIQSKKKKPEIKIVKEFVTREIKVLPKNLSDVEFSYLRSCLKNKNQQGLRTCLTGLYDRYADGEFVFKYNNVFVLKQLVQDDLQQLNYAVKYKNRKNIDKYLNSIIAMVWNWFHCCQKIEPAQSCFVIDWENISKLFYDVNGKEISIFEILLNAHHGEQYPAEHYEKPNKCFEDYCYFELSFGSIFRTYCDYVGSVINEDDNFFFDRDMNKDSKWFGVSFDDIDRWQGLAFDKGLTLIGTELDDFVGYISEMVKLGTEELEGDIA
jgi:predicted GIY-YIG superfamily endonuclease